MLGKMNNTPNQTSYEEKDTNEPALERTVTNIEDVDALFDECSALLAGYETEVGTPNVSPTEDTSPAFIPPKPKLAPIEEEEKPKPRFNKTVNAKSSDWKTPKPQRNNKNSSRRNEQDKYMPQRNRDAFGKCVIRARRVTSKEDTDKKNVFDDGLKPKTDSTNVTSVPGMIKQLRRYFSSSNGFTITANQPLMTHDGVSYSIPKCMFGHNDIMWFYDSIMTCIEKGLLDIKYAPKSKMHTTDSIELSSMDQLNKTKNYVNSHCVLTCPLQTRDESLESGRTSGRELKYIAFKKFERYKTPLDAFDSLITDVNFSELSNDFTDFIDATGGDYLLFVVLINKMCDELPLSQISQIVPIIPGSMTTDLYHSLDDCNTIDTSPGSYIHTVLDNMTDQEEKKKLEKRLEFVTYVQNICKTGLRTAVSRGPVTLTLKTQRDDEICVNNDLNQVKARMFTTMAIYAETIETAQKLRQ